MSDIPSAQVRNERLDDLVQDHIELQNKMRAHYGEVYAELLDVLYRHDMARIGSPDPAEYEPELMRILRYLRSARSSDDLVPVVHAVFLLMFWPTSRIGSVEDYNAVTQEM